MKKFAIALLGISFFYTAANHGMSEKEEQQIHEWFQLKMTLDAEFLSAKLSVKNLKKLNDEELNELGARIAKMDDLQQKMEKARNQMDKSLQEKLKKTLAFGEKKPMNYFEKLESIENLFCDIVLCYKNEINAQKIAKENGANTKY